MAHEILGNMFAGYREPAWHKLGQVFQQPIHNPMEALELIGGNYNVHKRPLFYQTLSGIYVPIEDQVALVRDPVEADPQERVLAVVGKDWGLLQNAQLMEIIAPMCEQYPVETIGVLRGGKGMFITLDAGEMDLAGTGDIQKTYFLLHENKDGQHGLVVSYVHLRVVCQNTLDLALSKASFTDTMPHRNNIDEMLRFRIRLLQHMHARRDEAALNALKLVSTHIEEEQAASIFQAAYPMPDLRGDALRFQEMDLSGLQEEDIERLRDAARAYERQVERAEAFVVAAFELYDKINYEHPNIAETAWAAANAVVELEDWRQSREADPYYSALFGERAKAKRRALAQALAIANNEV